MPASAATEQRWIYGAVPDLLFGCAGIYLLLIPLLLVPVVNGWVSESMTIWVAITGMSINAPHYGATLLRVYQNRQDRHKYALFGIWITAALFALLVVATRSPWLGSILVTVYVTWSPWHFSGQNYGLALMFMRRRGVTVAPTAKRLFYASFLLSFALSFLTIHAESPGLSVAPVPTASQMDDAVYQQISLGIPQSVMTPAVILLALAYAGALLGAGSLFLRTGRWRDLAPALLLVFMQATWFSVPAILRLTDTFTLPNVALSSVWISAAHSLQYLWVTSYYAKKTDEPQWLGRYIAKALLAGAALQSIPALIFAPRALGVVPFSAFAILLFSVINIHHFILDGAVWKLRDGRVANALLRSTPAKFADPSHSRPKAARRALVLAGWLGGVAAFAVGVVGLWEHESGWRAVRQGNYWRAITAAEHLRVIGRENDRHHARIALAMWQNGGSPELVLEHFQRSLEIRPTAAIWTQLGLFYLNPVLVKRNSFAAESLLGEKFDSDPDAALAAFQKALLLDPMSLPALVDSGSVLAERGDFDAAREALERARDIAPDHPQVARLEKRLSDLERAP